MDWLALAVATRHKVVYIIGVTLSLLRLCGRYLVHWRVPFFDADIRTRITSASECPPCFIRPARIASDRSWLWQVELNHLFPCAAGELTMVHCNLRIRYQNISVILRPTDGCVLGGWCLTTVVRAYASHLYSTITPYRAIDAFPCTTPNGDSNRTRTDNFQRDRLVL